MAYITQLTDINNETTYPRTVVGAITDSGGSSLSSILDNKVPRVPGKNLSTNDYTNAEKQKLEKASTDLEATKQDVGTLKSDVSTLRSDVNTAKANITGLNADIKRVESEINEFNISAIKREKYSSLQSAISALSVYLDEQKIAKMVGLKITYVDSNANKAKTYSYQGGSFVNVGSWSDEPLGGYNRKLFESAGAIFNKSTGFYELNGLTDITTKQMMDIYEHGKIKNWVSFVPIGKSIRTTIPISTSASYYFFADLSHAARDNFLLEILVFSYSREANVSNMASMCENSKYLREIRPVLNLGKNVDFNLAFYKTYELTYVHLKGLSKNIDFRYSKKLSVEDYQDSMIDEYISSLGYLVKYATNKEEITITLHHDAFVRVPQSLIDKATAKQIRIVDATPTV